MMSEKSIMNRKVLIFSLKSPRNQKALKFSMNYFYLQKGDLGTEKQEKQKSLSNLRNDLDAHQEKTEKLIKNLEDSQNHSAEQLDYQIKELDKKSADNLNDTKNQIIDKLNETSQKFYERACEEAQNNLQKSERQVMTFTKDEFAKQKEEYLLLAKKNEEKADFDLDQHSKDNQKNFTKLQHDMIDGFQDQNSKLTLIQDSFDRHKKENGQNLKLQADAFDEKLNQQHSSLKMEIKDKMVEAKKNLAQEISLVNNRLAKEVETLKTDYGFDNKKVIEKLMGEIEKSAAKLTFNFKELVGEEEKQRNSQIQEVQKFIQQVRGMLQEQFNQKIESTKSLARALVNQEAATREKAIEELFKSMSSRLQALENMLRALVESQIQEVKQEMLKQVSDLEKKIIELKIWALAEFKQTHEEVDLNKREQQSYDYLQEVYRQMREEEYDETIKNIEYQFAMVEEEKDGIANQLEQEINERQKYQSEIYQNLSNHDNILEQHSDELKRQDDLIQNQQIELQGQLDEHRDQLEQQGQTIDQQRQNFEQFQAETVNHLDDVNIDMEVRQYMEYLYGEIKEEQNGNQLDSINTALDTQKQQLTQHDEKLQEHQNTLDQHQDDMYMMEEKFQNKIDDQRIDMEVKDYLNDLYNKLNDEDAFEKETYSKNKFNKVNFQIKKVVDKIADMDKLQEQFEDKTESNFQIAEKAIKSHSLFLNEIDCRLTFEEMVNKICHTQFEEDLQATASQLEQQILDTNEVLNHQLEDAIGGLQQQMQENLEALGATGQQQQKSLEEIVKQHTEHINILNDKEQQIETELFLYSLAQKTTEQRVLDYITENMNNVQETFNDMKKFNVAQQQAEAAQQESVEDLKQIIEEELGKIAQDLENMRSFSESNQDTTELNLKDISSKVNEHSEQLSMISTRLSTIPEEQGSQQMNDLSMDFEQKITQLEKQIKANDAKLNGLGVVQLEEKIANLEIENEQKQVQLQEMAGEVKKIQTIEAQLKQNKGGTAVVAGPANGFSEVEKKQIEDQISRLYEEIEDIKDKAQKAAAVAASSGGGKVDGEIGNRVGILEAKLKDFPEGSEYRQEFNRLKQMMTDLQKEKEIQNNQLNSKMDQVNSNIGNIQGNISQQLLDNQKTNQQQQEKINNQLMNLLGKFDEFSNKIYANKD